MTLQMWDITLKCIFLKLNLKFIYICVYICTYIYVHIFYGKLSETIRLVLRVKCEPIHKYYTWVHVVMFYSNGYSKNYILYNLKYAAILWIKLQTTNFHIGNFEGHG